MADLKSMERRELDAYLASIGEKPYRAGQLYRWMHERLAEDYSKMSDLPAALRARLEEEAPLVCLKTAAVQESRLDGTRKYLFTLPDGKCVERVLMRYHHGNSVCISSQVGCRMGCSFCASTLGGKERDLAASEMLDQVYRVTAQTQERVSNVVVMGIGEPLDNYENLLRFLHILCGDGGLHLSQRSVTVSTCGIVEGIRALADEKLQITLALSLHAPNDEIRKRLMPVARRYSYDEVLDACHYYFSRTGRRVTFEYSLCEGINDQPEHARELAQRIRDLHGHVNLIPVNPVRERRFKRIGHKKVLDFKNELEKNGINATIRREMGADIDGACGQLRARKKAEGERETKDEGICCD